MVDERGAQAPPRLPSLDFVGQQSAFCAANRRSSFRVSLDWGFWCSAWAAVTSRIRLWHHMRPRWSSRLLCAGSMNGRRHRELRLLGTPPALRPRHPQSRRRNPLRQGL